MLIAPFQNVYSPNKELSLDESLLHFRGKLRFRVNKKKTRKVIVASRSSKVTTSDGYLLNMEMYSEAQAAALEYSVSKTTAIVLKLLKPYGQLLQQLRVIKDLKLRAHTKGTIRANRKNNPKKLVASKLKKGEHIWQRRGNVYVSKWKDKRDVLVITTRNHPRLVTTANKLEKDIGSLKK